MCDIVQINLIRQRNASLGARSILAELQAP
jgi:hypothetical protein